MMLIFFVNELVGKLEWQVSLLTFPAAAPGKNIREPWIKIIAG
jgi:hypothetical protein